MHATTAVYVGEPRIARILTDVQVKRRAEAFQVRIVVREPSPQQVVLSHGLDHRTPDVGAQPSLAHSLQEQQPSSATQLSASAAHERSLHVPACQRVRDWQFHPETPGPARLVLRKIERERGMAEVVLELIRAAGAERREEAGREDGVKGRAEVRTVKGEESSSVTRS